MSHVFLLKHSQFHLSASLSSSTRLALASVSSSSNFPLPLLLSLFLSLSFLVARSFAAAGFPACPRFINKLILWASFSMRSRFRASRSRVCASTSGRSARTWSFTGALVAPALLLNEFDRDEGALGDAAGTMGGAAIRERPCILKSRTPEGPLGAVGGASEPGATLSGAGGGAISVCTCFVSSREE